MTNGIKIGANFDFNGFSQDVVDEAKKIAFFNLSELATDEAQNNAPYKTGTLRRSIGREPAMITKRTQEVVIGPRKVPYAQRREYENFKNPDRKFYMKRAYTTTNKGANAEFENALKIAFKRKKIQYV